MLANDQMARAMDRAIETETALRLLGQGWKGEVRAHQRCSDASAWQPTSGARSNRGLGEPTLIPSGRPH